MACRVATEDVQARKHNLDSTNPHAVDADHGDPAELLVRLGESARADHLRVGFALETSQSHSAVGGIGADVGCWKQRFPT